MSLHRKRNPDDPFAGCLADSKGNVLKFSPENEPPPPAGQGSQLNFRSLPHYVVTAQQLQSKRQQHLPKLRSELAHAIKHDAPEKRKLIEDTIKLLQAKNQPIPISDEHEISYLYLQEYYKKHSKCDITKLDASAILNILSKSSAFTGCMKAQAAKVRDDVRNPWAHAIIDDWNDALMDGAFTEMEIMST